MQWTEPAGKHFVNREPARPLIGNPLCRLLSHAAGARRRSMRVDQYMHRNKGKWPPKGSKGVDCGEWLYWMAGVGITSGRVWVGDADRLTSDEGVVATIPKGHAGVWLRGMSFDGHKRFSRLRIAANKYDVKKMKKGKKLGRVTIDSGIVVACDLTAMEKNFSRKERQGQVQRQLLRAIDRFGPMGGHLPFVFDNKSEHSVEYFTPGLGDGTYPIFAVIVDGKQVGVEAVFLGREVKGWEKMLDAPMLKS
jgi:hypothetical protein